MVDRYTPMYAETATDRYCHMLKSPTGSFVRASDYDALAAERDALRKDAERYREWRRAFRDGECGLYNALCDAGSEAEHDAAIDAALGKEEPR